MARIKDLELKELNQFQQQGVVEATYSVLELDGERFFQIDTYGSPDRKIPGKRSQSIRLDKDAAKKLISLLQQEFSL